MFLYKKNHHQKAECKETALDVHTTEVNLKKYTALLMKYTVAKTKQFSIFR
jgi:hypothetical protein